MRAEQAQIQATIDQMPLPPKVLNQFNIQQDEKFYYMATKNKKAEVFANKTVGAQSKYANKRHERAYKPYQKQKNGK